jgi:hypothetical protein
MFKNPDPNEDLMLEDAALEGGSAWILTNSGKQFYALDPKPEQIEIADITHALAMSCRYAGHCTLFYSVGEHSVHVASWVRAQLKDMDFPLLFQYRGALYALLHDASEAYIADIPRPFKPFITNYKAIEKRIMQAVFKRFALPDYTEPESLRPYDRTIDELVHIADSRILMDEREQIMPPSDIPWTFPHADKGPLGVYIGGWMPSETKDVFGRRAKALLEAYEYELRKARGVKLKPYEIRKA